MPKSPEPKTKSKRGGARVGSGRKPKYPLYGKTVQIPTTIPELLLDKIDQHLAETGGNRSEWFTSLSIAEFRRLEKSKK